MTKNIIIGCIMLGILILAQSAVGVQYDYELAYGSSSRDSGFREAVAMDDWLERGRAAVSESPVFPDGVRLTAWGDEDGYEPGLASAIYYFKVPRWAQYLKITIRYRDASRDDTIAGRLWIKSADRDQYEALGASEEAPLYGDTFVLRSERSSETIIVPRSRHVEDDTVEMHIVAGGQDCLDIRDVRLVFLETRPGNFTIVHRTDNDYWDRWPRYRYAYHYYYWGPLFWPKTYVVYECWDVPSLFYWITWRPWFFINIIQVHHHHPWWGPRRYTVIYHVDVKQPPIKRKPLIHKRLKERNGYITKTIHPTPPTRKVVPPPVPANRPRQQEVRLQKEAKPPRTVETTINRDPTQRHLKEQPVRADKGREKPTVNTQTKTVKKEQVMKKSDAHSAYPSPTVTQHIQKEQPQPSTPSTTEQESRPNAVNREKTAQPPVRKKLKESDNKIPTTNSEAKPTAIRRDNQEQPALEKQQPKRPAANKQIKAVQSSQVTNKSDSRPARPSNTAAQPRTAKQQSRSRSVARETVHEPTKVNATQNHRETQGQTLQKDAKIEQGNGSQSHQEIQQSRPRGEQRRPR